MMTTEKAERLGIPRLEVRFENGYIATCSCGWESLPAVRRDAAEWHGDRHAFWRHGGVVVRA